MAKDDVEMSRSMQDNVLTVVLFNDELCGLVRSTVEVNLFTSRVYRTILSAAYAYIDRFGKAPKEHIADELEDALRQDNEEAKMLASILSSAQSLAQSINAEYVRAQLERFVRQQSLKVGIVRAHELLQDGDLDGAEVALDKAVRTRSLAFDPGLSLKQVVKLLQQRDAEREVVATGVDIFDRLQLGPAKGEFHLFIAPPKRGKSWWLTHITKRALMQRWRGVYVTLELSDKFVGRRQLMAQFALTSRDDAEVNVTRFVRSDEKEGKVRLEGLETSRKERPSLADDEVLKGLAGRLDDLYLEQRLLIKEFPTGTLTVNGLAAYLDNLERTQGWCPDFVVLDYADLMKIRADNYRYELGTLYKDLRGLAVERHFALVSASQSNREGARSKLITDTHAAEDYSKIATVDCAITYNQTAMERQRNLARLYVASGRVEADRFTVLISQTYATGQFVLDSMPMRDDYWRLLGADDEEEDEQ